MIELNRFYKSILLIAFVAVLALLLGGCCFTFGRQEQPIAELLVTITSGPAPLSVIFDISGSSDPDGTITSYELQFGDGASVTGANLSLPVSHIYADDGYYTAVLKVTDNDTFTDSAKLAITVNNPGPTVGFTCTPQVVQPGDTVTCTACGQATDPAGLRTEPKSIITYEWDFGDGHHVFSQACTATHAYADLGSFDVSLTIYDDDGAAAEETAPDYVTVRGKIYWTKWQMFPGYSVVTVGSILRANLNGIGREELVSDSDSYKWGIALDVAAGKMYWTDLGGTIQRADLDGGSIETLITGRDSPQGIALDVAAGKMYWTERGEGTIQRADLDGGNIVPLIDELDNPQFIALDVAAGKMYWTDVGESTVKRADLDGTDVDTLKSSLPAPGGIALDIPAGKMYWTDLVSGTIQRADLDGGSIEPLVTGLLYPQGIALDVAAGKMYWTNFAGQTIQRANMNGTSVEVAVYWTSLGVDVALEL